jgi:hypothetical protein
MWRQDVCQRPSPKRKLRSGKPVAYLRTLTELLPTDDYNIRLVMDTNAPIDNPDVGAYTAELGDKYVVHLLPVVLREIDDSNAVAGTRTQGGRAESWKVPAPMAMSAKAFA